MKQLISVIVFLTVLGNITVKSQSYAHIDIKYHRFNLYFDPAVLYLKGSVSTYFKMVQGETLPVYFDLASSITVDSVKSGNHKLVFSRNNHLLLIEPFTTQWHNFDSVTIYYQGVPATTGIGSFDQSTHGGSPIIWTLSEPYGARDWWPCKQVLADKIDSVDMWVTCPQQYRTAGNGVVATDRIENGNRIMLWKSRYPVAYYLIALAVTHYKVYSEYHKLSETDSLEILNYVFPESYDYALRSTPNLKSTFMYFHDSILPYPFIKEKYGHAQFGWGGGMEHQTMSFMVNFSTDLMVHEASHQWFGNYITCKNWSEIWINEGFAVFCEGLAARKGYYDESYLQWKRDEIRHITSVSGGSVFVTDTSNVWQVFDGRLTYAKGGMILHMLKHQLGDSVFFAALHNYVTDPDLAYGVASVSDFVKHAEKAAGKSLTGFFNDWYYGQGFPIYTIDWWQNESLNCSITISQNTSHSSVDFFELKVPVQLIGENNAEITYTFNNEINNQTFIVNPGFKVNQLIFDPKVTIISKGNRVVSKVPALKEVLITANPNPVKTLTTINLPAKARFNDWQLFSESGHVVQQGLITKNAGQFSVNMEHLPSGIYILSIKSNSEYATIKLVK